MKHHYIPQFYLKQWEGADKKLEVFFRRGDGRIVSKRMFRKATGYAVDLYKAPGVTEDTAHLVETQFMQMVDDEAVKVRDRLLIPNIPTNPDLRVAWARFVLSLVMRNPEELESFKRGHSERLLAPSDEFQKMYADMRGPDDPELFEEWMVQFDATQPERSSIEALTGLIVNPSVLRLLSTMHWRILDTSSVSRRLMTSDRPVALTAGMVHYQGHYALPIGPTRLFLATTTIDFAEDIARIPVGKMVRTVNEMVIGQARKYVYAVDDRHLSDVRKGMGKMEPPSLLQNWRKLPFTRND